MTIEDIRKENQSVFDKIDTEFAPNMRAGQYAKAYASILRDLEKKERSAQSYVRPNKKTVVGVIIAIVLLLVVGIYCTYIAVNVDDAHYAQTYTIYCSVAYSAAAIVAIVTTSVFAARYNRWKKISNKVVFLQEYMEHDKNMYAEYGWQIENEKFWTQMSELATAPARKSSSSNKPNSSSTSSTSTSGEQSSEGYFSFPSDRVNYKDGVRDWGYSENGRLYDSSNHQVGYVDTHDKVYDNNYNAVGWFDDNGTFHKY